MQPSWEIFTVYKTKERPVRENQETQAPSEIQQERNVAVWKCNVSEASTISKFSTERNSWRHVPVTKGHAQIPVGPSSVQAKASKNCQ